MEKIWQDKEWLQEEYKKYGTSTIAKKCGIDDATVAYWLKKFKIKMRSRSESITITHNRTHDVDVDYFKEIDSPEKAYWLGYLMADGSIRHPRSNIYYTDLELGIVDKEALQHFANNINYGNLTVDDHRARCNINNTAFTKNLMKWGVCQNKTGNESFPHLNKKLKRYFILGYFDGDGSIMFYQHNTHIRSRFHLVCMNKDMLESVKAVLEKDARVQFSPSSLHLKSTGNVYELETATFPNIAKIHDYFYQDCESYYLERKRKKFEQLIEHYITMPRLIRRYSPNCLETSRAK